MAISVLSSTLPLLITVAISMSCLHTVECVEFDVGGVEGWATPSSKNQLFYNDWASNNRFKVNDTLRFAYAKDSVMAVREEEYEKCRSTHPMFFSNNGDTSFGLDRPGLFYFISGVADHCQKGLKMVVKVLETEAPPHAASAPTPAFIPFAVASVVGVIFV